MSIIHQMAHKTGAKIYGASWDKSDTSTLTRTDAAVGMTANVGLKSSIVVNHFDTAEIYREMRDVVDSLGNVFVRIPKFYIRKVDTVSFKSWQVSKHKWSSEWYLPWSFWDFTNSRELSYVDIGKYPASSENINGTDRLRSLPNVFPLVSQTIATFRTRATNNNTGGLLGYQQLDIHAIDILSTLFFIEFATIDSQSIMQGWTIGNYSASHTATVAESNVNRIIVANATATAFTVGEPISVGTSLGAQDKMTNRIITSIDVYDASNKAISFDGATVSFTVGNIIYNVGWKNGFSVNIKSRSGSIGSNSTGKFPFIYRGIENPFGNIWQFVDGLNITNNQSWICKNSANYASDVFAAPYEQIGYINANTNNYINSTGYDSSYPFAEIPNIVTSTSTIKYRDYYYQSTGNRISLFGGYWSDGGRSGFGVWDLGDAASDSYLYFGGRVLRKKIP